MKRWWNRIRRFFDWQPGTVGEFVSIRPDGIDRCEPVLQMLAHSLKKHILDDWRYCRRIPVMESLQVYRTYPGGGATGNPYAMHSTVGWKMTTVRSPRLFRDPNGRFLADVAVSYARAEATLRKMEQLGREAESA
jgi:hypothetical protein